MLKKCLQLFVVAMLVIPGWGRTLARQDDAIELVYGQTVDGRLDPGQPSVFYAFEAQIGDVVTITMIVTEGAIDPFLVLTDSNQGPIATDDNSGGGMNARLTFVMPATGRYLIRATHAGGLTPDEGGAYSLNLTAAVNAEQPPVSEENSPTAEPAVPEAPEATAEPSELPSIQGDSIRLQALQGGTTVQDTLDRQVSFRLYWFEAGDGDQIAVRPQPVGDFRPVFTLYDGSFAEQQRVAPGIGLTSTLSQSGLYFLAVSLPDSGSAGGDYSFVFDLTVNPAAEADFQPIAYGQSQQGNIDSTAPVATYRFQGLAGDAVTIAMNRVGGDLNSYLYLLDGNGQLLFEDNDSGSGNGDALILYTLPTDGDYLIVTTRMGQAQGTTSGSYLLELTSDAATPVVEETETPLVLPAVYEGMTQIESGATVEGEISNFKYMDVYVFLGTQGDPVTIEMDSLNADEPNGLDPLLVLLDDNRIPLIENDDIVDGQQRDSRIEFTLPKTGYYAVVATRFDQDAGTSAGPYTLTLNGGTQAAGEPDTTTVSPTEPTLIDALTSVLIEPGVSVQQTFSAGASLYHFDAAAGTLVDVSVTTDPGLDSILILADQNLTEVMSSGTGSLTGITLPSDGRYLIILAPRFGPVDQASGGYILALTQQDESAPLDTGEAPIGDTRELVYGGTATGVIDDQAVSRLYTFTGSAGDSVRITMEAVPGSDLDCYLELQDAAGTTLDSNDDIDPGVIRNSLITAKLPADGTYQILASRYVGDDADPTSGSYRLTLEEIQDTVAAGVSPVTIPIAYGQSLVGEINDEQYLLFYVFDGTAGDAVTISIDNLSGNLDSVLYLYQSTADGWIEIANNDDSPTGGTYAALLSNIILPQSGKYLIAVSRYGLDREDTFGSFNIALTLAQ